MGDEQQRRKVSNGEEGRGRVARVEHERQSAEVGLGVLFGTITISGSADASAFFSCGALPCASAKV
jgi:hypothetical protein